MSSSNSEESEDDWEEPQLKYERMKNDVTEVLKRDAASCVALHCKFVALGTHWGMIYILDHQGNRIINNQLSSHNAAITGIALDETGEYIASCSEDGKICVSGLYSSNHNQEIVVDHPVKSIALHPNYSHTSSKQVIYGTESLMLSERTWLRRTQQEVLHRGEGAIRVIKWRKSLVAWANDLGVKIYDMKQQRIITNIPRSASASTSIRPELFPAHVVWKDDNTLLVGWSNIIKICVIREKSIKELREPSKYCTIRALGAAAHMLKTDFACCGMASLADQIVALAFIVSMKELDGSTDSTYDGPAARPELRILEPISKDGYSEVSRDSLSVRGYQNFRCNDYSLAQDASELYVVSPKDIVIAQKRDEDDRVAWLMQTNRYPEALDAVKEYGKRLKKHNYQGVGLSYLSHLMDNDRFGETAELCQQILGNNMELWEQIVNRFSESNRLRVIGPFLPRGDHRLPTKCYEMVLEDYLINDHKTFVDHLSTWPSSLYNISAMTNKVLSYLDRDAHNPTLLDALAKLYISDQRFEHALAIYLRLQHPDTFTLIRKHKLYKPLQENILPLMRFGGSEVVELLLDHMEYVPVDHVVSELEKKPNHLHRYLHALFLRDSHLGSEYHGLQVRLYAEFDRKKLLPFLKSSTYVALEEALKICEERKYVEEQVFLLSRMGNASRALSLITEHEADVSKAVVFCKEQNDDALWDELIDKSIEKPEFIRGLLENIGTHVDPIKLIRKIPTGMRIPGLRDALVKILQDYSMQTALWFECKRVLASDVLTLMRKQLKLSTKPLTILDDKPCDACGRSLLGSTGVQAALPVIICFLCHHAFHDSCLSSANRNHCSVCRGNIRHR